MEINAKMLAKAIWKTGRFHDSALPEKWDDLDEEQREWLIDSANVVLRHIAEQSPDIEHVDARAFDTGERIQRGEPGYHDPEATAQFAEAHKAVMAVREYAQRVLEIFHIEGGQIKENDPRLWEPDNRCPTCLATLKEPQKLTPVRREANEFLQQGNHFRSCTRNVLGIDPA